MILSEAGLWLILSRQYHSIFYFSAQIPMRLVPPPHTRLKFMHRYLPFYSHPPIYDFYMLLWAPYLHYSSNPLFLYSAIPLLHYSFTPLFLYSTIPLLHYSFTQLFVYSTIPLFHYSFTPQFLYSTISLFH